jgi:PIN domain nuclease of toxin-antitoxin system
VHVVIDTHVLKWLFAGDRLIGAGVQAVINDPTSRIIVSTIVLAELFRMYHKGTIELPMSDLLRQVSQSSNIAVYPFDVRVVTKLNPGLELHDAIIVATALTIAEVTGETVPVITCDRQIVESGLVEILW